MIPTDIAMAIHSNPGQVPYSDKVESGQLVRHQTYLEGIDEKLAREENDAVIEI